MSEFDKFSEAVSEIKNNIFDTFTIDNKGNPVLGQRENDFLSSRNIPTEIVPSLKEPPSILAKRYFFKEVKEKYSKYSGFNLDKIIGMAQRYKNNSVEYYDWMYKQAAVIFNNNNIEDVIEMRCICDAMDNIFLQLNSKRFVIDIDVDNLFEMLSVDGLTKKTPKQIIDTDPMKNIKDFEDSIFDFRDSNGLYIPMFYRINQVIYTLDYGKYKDLSPINYCGIMWRNNSPEEAIPPVVMFEGLIVPEIYPKLLLLRETYPLCRRNDRSHLCIKKEIAMHETSSNNLNENMSRTDPNTKLPICQMTPNLALNSHCPMLSANPWMILKYLSYAWDMYSHRNSIMHKNSKRKAGYTHNKVHVAKSESNEYDYSIVPLHIYYDTERRNHEYKGGHHSSPCEHERAATYRRIFNKDGTIKKIVPVKGCTVNAGNQKTEIVQIKTPKRKEE